LGKAFKGVQKSMTDKTRQEGFVIYNTILQLSQEFNTQNLKIEFFSMSYRHLVSEVED